MNGTLKWIMGIIASLIVLAVVGWTGHVEGMNSAQDRRLCDLEQRVVSREARDDERWSSVQNRFDRLDTQLCRIQESLNENQKLLQRR